MTSLTGLELNLYERAGYLVRRGAFDPAAAGGGIPDEVMTLCIDILGMEVEIIPDELLAPPGWHRATGRPIDARESELAQMQDAVLAVTADSLNPVLCLLPGSHLQPLELREVEKLRMNPADELSGQVCLTLDIGDALLLSPTVLRMHLPHPDSGGIRIWIVRKIRRAVAGGRELCV